MYYPEKSKFVEAARPGTVIPLYTEILADLETPVSAYQKTSEGDYGYLLESVESGVNVGRYSFIGLNPRTIFRAEGKNVEVTEQGIKDSFSCDDPLLKLEQITGKYTPACHEDLDLPFWGGPVGYVSFDYVRFFERLPDKEKPGNGYPDLFFVTMENILAFDQLRHRIRIIHNAFIDGNPEEAYRKGIVSIQRILEKFKRPYDQKHLFVISPEEDNKIEPEFPKDDFLSSVERIKEYIRAGDVFQCVLSQRFHTKLNVDPFNVYRSLRVVNPSPYMFYLNMGDVRLIGSSPEVMVRKEGNRVMVKPIAGTRPRGKTSEEDQKLEKELLEDAKERAEHLMLVDLGRNDVGRIADQGTVKVRDFMMIERYSHVMHIVSTVTGECSADLGIRNLVRATFPAGTVSGAPKIRAMEIIDELEPGRREVYSGLVGYYGFTGNFDSCITIRTITQKDDKYHIQVGAGIVADSVPENEFDETVNKGMALFRAIQIARGGLK